MKFFRLGVGPSGLAAVFVVATAVLAEALPQGAAPQGGTPAATQTAEGGSVSFVIGFGGGVGWTNWTDHSWDSWPPQYRPVVATSHVGVATNFKIGVAIKNRVLILFHSTGTIFSENGETMMDGMGGGTVQFYLGGTRGKAAYVLGGAGYQNVMHFNLDNPYSGSNSVGFGVRGGAGFEFAKYLTVEGVVQHGFNDSEHNPTSFTVTFNFIRR
jgi:hypothetical protein